MSGTNHEAKTEMTPPADEDAHDAQYDAPPNEEPAMPSKRRSLASKKVDASSINALAAVITDKMAAHTREMQAFAAECFLGVSQFPLQDPPSTMKWGKHNTRNVNDAATAVLLKNFEKRGLHNADPDSLIRIGLKPEWFAGTLIPSSVGKTVLELPAWELTDEGHAAMKDGLIVPFSGNHRKHALKAHYELAEKRLKTGENELKRMLKDTSDTSPEYLKAIEDKKEQVEMLKSHFAHSALWGAAIYDLSK